MGDNASAAGYRAAAKLSGSGQTIAMRQSIALRRAELVVACARELEGAVTAANGDVHLPISVLEFEQAIRQRYAASHPDLVFRTDSTLERARLERPLPLRHIPKVILRQGAPRRS